MFHRFLPLLALLLAGCGKTSPTTPQEVDPQWPVGPFSLTERSGKTVTDKDLRGQRCTGPCPTVSATVGQLQRDLKDEPRIRFVTFTVDPEHDNLERLREYANTRQADPDRWLFLTGDEKTMHQIVSKQFKQAVERHLGLDVEPGDEFEHSTRLILVDKEGVIRGIYPGMPNPKEHNSEAAFAAALDRLKTRARELQK
jgi:cytochrome oxidase Cu insertion factor (SCO1/SenC/PrrC family)